ncbi:hypothetical protein DPMN_069521 [Dreissena polymorpha]|uniref:Uncharacterized protein n=1 Tax=Dreissena polymorpha TaxID=45954 RepID=A0A9D3YZ95_DREPO|nr:hypothetical protein DPMN_069521 [Dreissena polymorpha]
MLVQKMAGQVGNPLFSNSWGETLSAQKSALRWDIKRTMKNLCGKLLELGEQCFVVTVNPKNGYVGHMGTQLGSEFIEEHSQILYDFLGYCEDALADTEPSEDSSNSGTESDGEGQNTVPTMGTTETSPSPLHDSLKDILQEPDRDQLPLKLYISALSGHVGPKLQQRILGKSTKKNIDGTCSVEKVGSKPTGKMDKGDVKDDVEKLDDSWPNKTSTYVDTCIDKIEQLEDDSSFCKSTKASRNKDNDLLYVDLLSKGTQISDRSPSVEIKTEAEDEVMVQNERKQSKQTVRQTLKRSEISSQRKRKFDEDDLTETDEDGDENKEDEEEQSEMDDNDTDYKPGK